MVSLGTLTHHPGVEPQDNTLDTSRNTMRHVCVPDH